MNAARKLMAVTFLLTLTAGVGRADDSARHPDLYYSLGSRPETPHVAWAKPWAGGRIRVLVIAARWQMREAIEVGQRLDAEVVPMMLYSSDQLFSTANHWGHEKDPGIKQEAVLADFRTKLQADYDVILLARAPTAEFPDDIREALLAKIRAGTGLVWCWPRDDRLAAILRGETSPVPDAVDDVDGLQLDDPAEAAWSRLAFLHQGVPFELLSGFGVEDRHRDLPSWLNVVEYGGGRAALLAYPGGGLGVTPSDPVDLHYEYALSFLLKALLWGARREGDLIWADLPASCRGSGLTATVSNHGPAVAATLAVAIRSARAYWRVPVAPWPAPGVAQTASAIEPVWTENGLHRVARGDTVLDVSLPPLPAGDYFVDLQLSGPQGKLCWGTSILRVGADATLTSVACVPSVLDAAGPSPRPLAVKATLDHPLTRPGVVDVSVIDNYGQVLVRELVELPPGHAAADVTLALSRLPATLLTVRAALLQDERTLSVACAYVTAIHRPWDRFTFFMWGGPGAHYLDRQRYRVIAGLRVDAVRGGPSLEKLRVADIRTIADLGRWAGQVDKATLRVQPCFSSEAFHQEVQERIGRAADLARSYDTFGVMFGDEFQYCSGGLPGSCHSPSCVAHLRRFLASRYGAVEKLNTSWGTAYEAFDDVMPAASRNAALDAGRENGRFSPLVDQWLNNDALFSSTVGKAIDELRRQAPGQHAGPSTPLWNWHYRAYDWEALMQHCDFATPYGPWADRTHPEGMAAFAVSGTLLSLHSGSYVNASMHDVGLQRLKAYLVALRGGSNLFYYRDWGNEGGIAPSLQLYPCLDATRDAVGRLKDGLAELLLAAEAQKPAVAIHWSRASYYFSFLVSGPHVPWRCNALIDFLRENGYPFTFVSTRQIEAGKLDEYRVLLMPVSQCIGDREASRLHAFVQQGGTVIADIRPGIADEHGNMRAINPLSDVFGVTWPGLLTGEGKELLRGLTKVDDTLSVDRQAVPGEAATRSVNGHADLLARHRVGRGTAICLNTPFSKGPAMAMLADVMRESGLSPCFDLPVSGLPGFEGVRRHDGQAEYVGLTRRDSGDGSLPVTVTFDKRGFVHDVLEGTCYGEVDGYTLALPPSSTVILARLPYRVQSVAVTLDRTEWRPGETVQGTVRIDSGGAKPVRHVLHLSVHGPDGEKLRWLGRNLTSHDGEAAFSVPLALNAASGRYSLTLADTATRIPGELSFVVAADR